MRIEALVPVHPEGSMMGLSHEGIPPRMRPPFRTITRVFSHLLDPSLSQQKDVRILAASPSVFPTALECFTVVSLWL